MAKQSNQKAKLLYLQKFLMEETDAQHGITIAGLVDRLAEAGIAAERKSLYDDIEVLRAFGMQIETVRGRANSYKLTGCVLPAQDVIKTGLALKAAGTEGAEAIIESLCGLLSKYDAESVKNELAAAAVMPQQDNCPGAAVQAENAENIELKCNAELKDAVLAYFGAQAQVVKTKSSGVVISAQANCNEDFYVQLIKWGSGVKLTSPAERRKEFVKYCKKIISQYK